MLALAPVDQQVLDQERRRDHAHAVVHEAGVPELAHAGIDDGIAGAAALPGAQRLGVLGPREGIEAGVEVGSGEIGMVEQQVIGELAPAELRQELFDIAVRGGAVFRGACRRVPDLARADLAETQVRRQARRDAEVRAGRGRRRSPAGAWR